MIDFIDSKQGNEKKMPDLDESLGEIGKFSNPESILYGHGYTEDSVGVFDNPADCITQTLEYIEEYYPEFDKTQTDKRQLYLELLFKSIAFGKLLSNIENQDKVCMTKIAELILGSEDMLQIFIECRGEETWNKIKKFTCQNIFSQDNPQ